MKTGFLKQTWARLQRDRRIFGKRLILLAAGALLCSGLNTRASDPLGLYALIDKIKLEPNEQHPERLLIWGTFSIAEGERGPKYKSPEKGYLYFTLPKEKSETALKEWADLASVAGKNEVVGFSSRYGKPPTVRPPTEKPKDPDVFRTGFGVVRMERRGTDYGPIKALLEGTTKRSGKDS